MKAEIQSDGILHITPETATEGFALQQIISSKNACGSCFQSPLPVFFDLSVIAGSMPLQKTN